MQSKDNESLLDIDFLRKNYIYDPETGALIRLSFNKKKNKIIHHFSGSLKKNGYIITCIKIGNRKPMFLNHRLAWAYHYGEFPDGMIDHINGNPSDNRISNLRICTDQENRRNMKMRKGNLAGAKGVHKTPCNKYCSQIKINYKSIFLGNFSSVDEAAHAYNKAAIKYFGEFSVLNPIGNDYD